MILGAMIAGRITFNLSAGFYQVYISPWLNPFCFCMGIFSTVLFAYQAAVFLVGETRIENERLMYVKFARRLMLLAVLSGLMVFVVAEIEGIHLTRKFIASAPAIAMFVLAGLLCPVIWKLLDREKNKTLYLRIGTGVQVTTILLGWFTIQFPVMLQVKGGQHLTFYNTQAPPATLQQLLIALIAGLLLVVPGFFYLFRVFKIADSIK